MIEREASARKNNNHNTERQGEMGGQMNWTISLQARAGQALSKTERMREWRAEDRWQDVKLWCQKKLRRWKEVRSRLHQFFRNNHWISHAESSSSYINNDLHTFSSLQILSKWKMGWIKKAILFYFVVVFWFQNQPCELESTPSRQQMDSIKGSLTNGDTRQQQSVAHYTRRHQASLISFIRSVFIPSRLRFTVLPVCQPVRLARRGGSSNLGTED